MNLFTKPNEPTKQERIAREVQSILDAPRRTAEQVVMQWERDFDALWATRIGNPAEKLAVIGTDAAALFSTNTAWTTALITILTGKRDDLVKKITDKLAALPAFTVNQDGTVTLD